jgi:predicted Zn finger-like uncharacterized protein
MNKNYPHALDTKKKKYKIDNYRVAGERLILYMSMLFCLSIFLAMPLLFGYLELLLVFLGVFITHIIVVKIHQAQLIGQCVKVSESQFSQIYNSAKVSASNLRMEIPEIFIKQEPTINAYAIGFIGKKSVILHSKTVSSMKSEELISILGHEFSHIKLKHTNWAVVTSSVSGAGIPILSKILQFIFLFWSRKAEFSCDRGSIIACGNLQAAVNALIKIAVGEELFNEVSIDDFENQGNDGWFNRFAGSFSTHPYLVKRVLKLKEFYERYVLDTEKENDKKHVDEIDEIKEGRRIIGNSFDRLLSKKVKKLQQFNFIKRICLSNLYKKAVLLTRNKKLLNNLDEFLRKEKQATILKLEMLYYKKIIDYVKAKNHIKISQEKKNIYEGTCTKCNSKFRIDKSIIPIDGIYVKCRKCSELFLVKDNACFQIIAPVRLGRYSNWNNKKNSRNNISCA